METTSMKKILTAFCFVASLVIKAEQIPTLLAASATSSTSDSSLITCLLDLKCNGYWSPQVSDGGNDEGIYLQFLEETAVNFIKISFSNVSDSSFSANIIEGNWEPKGDQIRIFGKKYTTSLRSSEYLHENIDISQSTIFQSEVKIVPYSQLPENERKNILAFLLKTMKPNNTDMTDKGNGKIYWPTGIHLENGTRKNDYRYDFFEANSETKLINKVDTELKKRNPFYIKSTVFSGLVMPAAEVKPCTSGCLIH